MEASGTACPACRDTATKPVEVVWEARHFDTPGRDLLQRVAPPTPRNAASNDLRFYALGFTGVVGLILATIYACSLVAARAAAVFYIATLGGVVALTLLLWLFVASPQPTGDQIAALDEWKRAHAEWQQKRVCLRCAATFLPRVDEA
jgi:hypothetical protein